jgi:hypothetical protein
MFYLDAYLSNAVEQVLLPWSRAVESPSSGDNPKMGSLLFAPVSLSQVKS